MNFSIVFDSTGDSIPFQTISRDATDILLYYVEKLNDLNVNKFTPATNIGNVIQSNITDLHSTIIKVNEFIYELLDQYIETYSTEEYLNQNILNKLHADWAHTQSIKYNIIEKRKRYNSKQSEFIHSMFPDEIEAPFLNSVLYKLGFTNEYNHINLAIHHIEDIFKQLNFNVDSNEAVIFENPFPKSFTSNGNCNFALPFNHLGRALYNRFYYDRELTYDDENTFDELVGYVEIKLTPPQSIQFSQEYIDWCKRHNKIPSGMYLNIGNIPDLDKDLFKYRKIIFRNTLQNNNFSVQLNKGK